LVYENLKIKIYRTTIFTVLYGCETWALTLRKECRLKVFENNVSRRILWPKRDAVTSEWRKLYNEMLNDLHSSLCIFWVIKSTRMKWEQHVAHIGVRGYVYWVLVGKPE
jgi:hypothetical protein